MTVRALRRPASAMRITEWRPLAAAVAALAAAAPALLAAASLIARRPVIYFDGDPALDELALINSGHLAQLVGNYSRFGWEHPGPAWFYALDLVYQPLGAESWAFNAAVAVFQAVLALLILYACWRIAGLPLVATGSALLLGYYALVGDGLFLAAWPPYAVVLPMLLLLLLAGLTVMGSTPAIAGMLVVGSFEVQTHVGTAPTVAVVVAGAFVLRLALDRLARREKAWRGRPDGRRKWQLAGAGLALTVLMWIPPLIDEVTGNPGNLTALFRFFLTYHSGRGFRSVASTLGRLVDPIEFPNLHGYLSVDMSSVSDAHIAIAVAFAAVCAALAIAGWRVRDRFTLGLGVVLLLALVAITFSIRDVIGNVYSYLLLWVTTLPLAALLGVARLGFARRPAFTLSIPPPVRRASIPLVIAVLLIVAAVQTSAFLAVPDNVPLVAHVDQMSAAAEAALASDPSQPVVVDPTSLAVWDAAAAVGLQLVKHGHPIRVADPWLFMFGKQSRLHGDEQWALTFTLAAEASPYQATHPGARLLTTTDVYAVFLRKIR